MTPSTVTRAVGLFRFLAALNSLKSTTVLDADEFAKASDTAVIWLDDLPRHPAIQLNADSDGTLLSVRRATAGAHVEAVHRLHHRLFAATVALQTRPEDLELVLGVGLLAYAPGTERIRRHLLTVPVRLDLDEHTGRVDVVSERGGVLQGEANEFLTPSQIRDSRALTRAEAEAANITGGPLDSDALVPILQELTLAIDPRGSARLAPSDAGPGAPAVSGAGAPAVSGAGAPAVSGAPAVCTFSPALILRERTGSGLADLLDTIAHDIETTGRVPEGLLPLIDPDHIPPVRAEDQPGAMIDVAGEPFLPLPLNDTQRKVIARVEHNAQVVVQGPPGTGKTHLIATLVSHLLAQGKRVLVTAQTDRALAQVRTMLPEPLQPLAVGVLNTSRDEATDLRASIERIAEESVHDDPEARRLRIDRHTADIERMTTERSRAYEEIVSARRHETRAWPESGVNETLAGIHRNLAERAPDSDWVLPYYNSAHPYPSMGGAELATFRRLTRRADANADRLHLITQPILEPTEFARLQVRRRDAIDQARPLHTTELDPWHAPMLSLPPLQRKEFATTLVGLRTAYTKLRQQSHDWLKNALDDVLTGDAGVWLERRRRLAEVYAEAETATKQLGTTTEVLITNYHDSLEPIATLLRNHAEGSPIKVDAQGKPRIGVLAPKQVRAASGLFANVTVNGRPPTTVDQIDALLGQLRLERLLRLLDAEWSKVTTGTPAARLRRHRDALKMLSEIVDFHSKIGGITAWFTREGWPIPDWTDFRTGTELSIVVDALPALEHEVAMDRAIEKVRKQLEIEATSPHAADCVRALSQAAVDDDVDGYAEAYTKNLELLGQRDHAAERRRLGERIREFSPALADALADPDSASDEVWEKRLAEFDQAWSWGRTHAWLTAQKPADSEPARDRIAILDAEITRAVAKLAGERAWAHALAGDRLTPGTRAALVAYGQQVRQLGKGTGRYANRIRSEIRGTMTTARAAVPVWIMPLYRIAEQLDPTPNSFDVVIVDEASQAGVEAVFLHYLAPRIVVVGDDKQVSPAGVGRDQNELRDLVRQHIPDSSYGQLWANPMRSLFDEASMRYGSRLVLTEHRRSVPEIIGFSNAEFYQPDGVRLEPVRQYATSGLEPIRTIHVPHARIDAQVNRAEVDALVDEVVRCVKDPRYAGLSFGVITLLGSDQARVIEQALLQQLPAEEWSRRQLMCGEAPAFQGSERDVIFLSMVAAPTGQRLVAQTRDVIAQRYNVAVSRARDQVVLLHSVELSDLTNPADLRHRLLAYAQEVDEASRHTAEPVDEVATAVVVPPFESLFEAQVFNRLARENYDVRAQVELLGHRTDLVVRGRHGSLAIECESDRWSGEEVYNHQLRRRRDLEDSGWTFVTLRESAFEADPEAALEPLWLALDRLGIQPLTEVPFGPEWQAADQSTPQLSPLPRAAELEEYLPFTGRVALPDGSNAAAVRRGVQEIIAVEGPVTGSRLEQAYAVAAGTTRLTGVQRTQVHAQLRDLVESGDVVEDDPGQVLDPMFHDFRLPDQRWAQARTLGPRRLKQVPLAEVALLLDVAHYQAGDVTEDERFRVVLHRLGLTRLTNRVREFLRTADELG